MGNIVRLVEFAKGWQSPTASNLRNMNDKGLKRSYAFDM